MMFTIGSRAGRSREDHAGKAGSASLAAERHPLPWQNTPAGGENHVTDARGATVYQGCDASEMFRLLDATTHAEPARRHSRALHRLLRRRHSAHPVAR
jgi:hypothetical protein